MSQHNALYKDGSVARATLFDGRWYASRSEAKWAYVFTSLGVPFYYEPSHYALSSGIYLPDFWLPTLDAYLEVKPVNVADPRYNELGEMQVKRVFLASGDIPYVPYVWSESEIYPHLRGHIWLKWPYDVPDYMLAIERQGRVNIVPIAFGSTAKGHDPRILSAYVTATSAVH